MKKGKKDEIIEEYLYEIEKASRKLTALACVSPLPLMQDTEVIWAVIGSTFRLGPLKVMELMDVLNEFANMSLLPEIKKEKKAIENYKKKSSSKKSVKKPKAKGPIDFLPDVIY